MKKLYTKISLMILIFLLLPAGAYADEAYRGYNYNMEGSSIPAPNGYEPDKCITGNMLGIGSFDSPEDIYVEKSTQTVYILDSGNKRIVLLNKNLKYSGKIDKFYDNGKELQVGKMTGIFVVPSVGIYLADGDNSRVLCVDFKGNLIKAYEKPDSSLYIGNTFIPKKVLADSAGNLYAICNGAYQGAVVFDNVGKFSGYFGGTKVIATPKVVFDSFWKKIMTKEQKETMTRYIPIEYVNFDIDKKDFVYSATQVQYISSTSIRKLNPKGNNILNAQTAFGDYDYYTGSDGKIMVTQFYDIHVDEEGFIYALDMTNGKIFQYDSEGKGVFIFGMLGSQYGTFRQPVAIDTLDKTVLVLDMQKKCVNTFKLTEFGKYVDRAIVLYNEGLYDKASEPWFEVIKRNSNYELAYVGLGKAAMNLYRYDEAMKYFKIGKDRVGYSKAFKQYRMNYVRNHFSSIAACLLIIVLLAFLISKRKKLLMSFYNLRSGKSIIR